MISNASLSGHDFLLVEGGPLFHIEARLGISKKHASSALKRAGLAAFLTWVPLLVLSAIQGRAFTRSVPLPLLFDASAYTRFLISMPLLLIAEVIIGPRVAEAASHFVTSGVVREEDYTRFDDIVARGLRSRDSALAEVILLILVVSFSLVSFRSTAVHVSSWYMSRGSAGAALTWAGWWLVAVCVPLYQFLILRWIWRLFLWFQFLSRVCKLNLRILPTHPDHAGGLGFIGKTQSFFSILLFAYSVGVAGVLSNDIIYNRTRLQSLAPAIAIYLFIALLLLLAPLAVFMSRLFRTKRHGLYEYGALASTYTDSFHRKWILHEDDSQEALLGTADIQSLADLGNSYALVENMNILPINIRTLVQLAVAGVLPLTGLLLTVMPLKSILKLLFKVLV
jgi:hypothetical protein